MPCLPRPEHDTVKRRRVSKANTTNEVQRFCTSYWTWARRLIGRLLLIWQLSREVTDKTACTVLAICMPMRIDTQCINGVFHGTKCPEKNKIALLI